MTEQNLTLSSRRRALTTLGAMVVTGASGGLAGCASTPGRDDPNSRTYCLKSLLPRRVVCASGPIPSLEIEAQAKLFEPIPDVFTLYVVRWAASDAVRKVIVTVDDLTSVTTLPRTMFRIRLRPGMHELAFDWHGATRRHRLEARKGEVGVVEIGGGASSFGETYHWKDTDPAGARLHAQQCTLIADL